jgi:acetyltransferase-like isoleucine patch superfamily enzyme
MEGDLMKPLELAARCCRYITHLPGRATDKLDELRKSRSCIAGPGARLFPSSTIHNNRERDCISIGANTHIKGELLALPPSGEIEVGRDCFIGEDTRIWSMVSVTIGHRVLISHNVNIHDNNSHSLSAGKRHKHYLDIITTGHPLRTDDIDRKPIVIEDDVWIGFNSTILKGVTIGRGAVVGACSLVTKDVAPFTIVAGNPAQPIGQSLP